MGEKRLVFSAAHGAEHAAAAVSHAPAAAAGSISIRGIKEGIRRAYGAVEGKSRPIRGILGGLWDFTMAPITAPARFAIKGMEQGYRWAIKPVAYVVSVTLGTAKEAAAGVWDATAVPLWTVAKSPFRDVKMNLVDLPIGTFRSVMRWPGNLLRAPGRFVEGIKQMTSGIRENITQIFKQTPENVNQVLDHLLKLHPWEAMKETVRGTRELLANALLRPARNLVLPLTLPLMPLTEPAQFIGKTVLESKTQYATAFKDSFDETRSGIRRILNAPGHHLEYKPLQLLRGEKPMGHAHAAHPAPAAADHPAPEHAEKRAEPKAAKATERGGHEQAEERHAETEHTKHN